MSNEQPVTPPQDTKTPSTASRWTPNLIIKIVAGVLIGIVILIFVLGLLLALFGDATLAAPRVQIIRDIFIIILAFQGILVVGALAVLILQIARLINLLQNEVMPILKNTEETVNTARGTVEFVGSNLTEPVIRVNGFLAAISILLRELFGIRRVLRRSQGEANETDSSES